MNHLAAPAAVLMLALLPYPVSAGQGIMLAQSGAPAAGVCLVYGPDRAAYAGRRLAALESDLQMALAAEPAIAATDIGRDGEAVSFTLQAPSDADRLQERLAPALQPEGGHGDAELAATISEGAGRIGFAPGALDAAAARIVAAARDVVAKRVEDYGISGDEVRLISRNRLAIAAAGVTDVQRIDAVVRPAGTLAFHQVLSEPAGPGDLTPGAGEIVAEGQDGSAYTISAEPLMEGRDLAEADAVTDAMTGMPVVSFRFSEAGTRRFADITAANVGRPIAIVMDGRVYAAPIIREPITGGAGQVSGNMTMADAETMASLLRSGALQAPLALLWQGPLESCARLNGPEDEGSGSAGPGSAG